jgi:hypothetical protein
MERRQKGDRKLCRGEFDPRVERGQIGEESSRFVCREETNGGGKFEGVIGNTIARI